MSGSSYLRLERIGIVSADNDQNGRIDSDPTLHNESLLIFCRNVQGICVNVGCFYLYDQLRCIMRSPYTIEPYSIAPALVESIFHIELQTSA